MPHRELWFLALTVACTAPTRLDLPSRPPGTVRSAPRKQWPCGVDDLRLRAGARPRCLVPVDLVAEGLIGCPDALTRGGDAVVEIAYDDAGRVTSWRSVAGEAEVERRYVYRADRVIRAIAAGGRSSRAELVEGDREILETSDDGSHARYRFEDDGSLTVSRDDGVPTTALAWRGDRAWAADRTFRYDCR